MRGTRIVTRKDIEAIADMSAVVDAVEGAFRSHAAGEAQMPSKVYVDLPEHGGDFRAMPAAMAGAAGLKWVNSHPDNPSKHGLPSVMGVYILSDPATAYPLAILDGTLLTALRTGAAAGVASRHLGLEAPETIGFIGCGVQSLFLLDAHLAVFGASFDVLCSDMNAEAAARLVEAARVRGLNARRATAEEAAGAHILNTATPGRSIAVEASWVGPRTHVNAMGADAPGKQELEAELLSTSQVFIDEAHQATHSGEINVPISEGRFRAEDIRGTLGELILGRVEASREARSIFDSTGLAVQDVAVARILFEAAQKRDVGQVIDLVGAA